MSWRWAGNVRTSKSWTSRFVSGMPSSAVASRTSRASVSGAKPSGSDFVAIENATYRTSTPCSTSRAIVPPQPNSPSSVCGARTSARLAALSIAGFSHCLRFTPRMTHETLAEVAALAGAAGAALVVLGRPRRFQLVGGLALLAAAETMLLVALLPRDDLERLASVEGIAALVVGALAATAGAWAFVRWPAVVPVALLLAAPFRIPVELGSQDAFLLLPLYVVLAAASLALIVRPLRGDELATIPIWIAAPGAALIGWASLSLAWALDPEEGAIVLLFFV